jgi:hypothetical protein
VREGGWAASTRDHPIVPFLYRHYVPAQQACGPSSMRSAAWTSSLSSSPTPPSRPVRPWPGLPHWPHCVPCALAATQGNKCTRLSEDLSEELEAAPLCTCCLAWCGLPPSCYDVTVHRKHHVRDVVRDCSCNSAAHSSESAELVWRENLRQAGPGPATGLLTPTSRRATLCASPCLSCSQPASTSLSLACRGRCRPSSALVIEPVQCIGLAGPSEVRRAKVRRRRPPIAGPALIMIRRCVYAAQVDVSGPATGPGSIMSTFRPRAGAG